MYYQQLCDNNIFGYKGYSHKAIDNFINYIL